MSSAPIRPNGRVMHYGEGVEVLYVEVRNHLASLAPKLSDELYGLGLPQSGLISAELGLLLRNPSL